MELTSRVMTPCPRGLLREPARMGSWGWQPSGKLILDTGVILLCPCVLRHLGQTLVWSTVSCPSPFTSV